MKYIIVILLIGLVACGQAMQTKPGGEQNTPADTTPAPGDGDNPGDPGTPSDPNLITAKVRVYVLSFAGSPSYNTTFDQAKVAAFVSKMNQIYAQAGIKVELESVIPMTVPAAQVTFTANETGQSTSQKLAAISFPARPAGNLLQAAFFRNFPVPAKGLYVPPQKTAFIAEYAPNGSLNDGLVLAHEMGHELSLAHVNKQGEACPGENLMCVGGSGISDKLTAAQIADMRQQVLIGPWTK